MTLDSEQGVRDFLRRCLKPGYGREERSFETLARILPDWVTDQFTEHAPPLAALREKVRKADAAAERARARYADGLRTWTLHDPAATELDPRLCPQNLVGDKAARGEHHLVPTSDPGVDVCVFCGPSRTYAFNRHSLNRRTKHAHEGGRTLCPSGFETTEPLDADRASGLPLCGGCRRALTNDSKETN
ncbi:hypothetical protein OV450_1444 [Actinobacteria bacterium OV450]|nr:hypothetical protein OV450_1444 [Actinobacteria bacterium OV450]